MSTKSKIERRSTIPYVLLFGALVLLSSPLVGCIKRSTDADNLPPVPKRDPLLADDTPIDENFSIQSTPSGAVAKLSSGESCKTPCSVKKRNIDNFDVRISKDGYKTQRVDVMGIAKVVPGSGAKGTPTIDRPHLVPNPLNVVLEPNWTKR